MERAYVPNSLLFNRLVNHTSRNAPCIKDIKAGYTATSHQLLSDAIFLAEKLGSVSGEYIPLLAPGSYDYAVGFVGILAASAIVVPVSTAYPVAELRYFIDKCEANRLLVHHEFLELALGLQKLMPDLTIIDIGQSLRTPLRHIFINPGDEVNYNKPGLVIFTSGTTGPPKACVHKLSIIETFSSMLVDFYGVRPGDVIMHCLPVHHATGILVTFAPFLHAGACVEFHPGFDTEKTWNRWLEGGISYFSGVATIFMRMARYLEGKNTETYEKAARQFKGIMCGTSALPRPLESRWLELTGGKRFLQRFGATEFGAVYMTPMDQSIQVPNGSAGSLVPGVDAKLSSQGEVLIKRPTMFIEYLKDKKATEEAFVDGYFKSGDIVRQEGEFFFVMGRKSIDIIKSGGYKISALDVERELLSLGYIAEAMVVPVADEEYGHRVAAAVVLDKREHITIQELRKDLEGSLARYKMPTLLRIVSELPKNSTGKVVKKQLRDVFFDGSAEVHKWRSSKL